MLDKNFSPADVEERLYAQWEASGAFVPDRRPDAPPFCIVIPPPNVTGRLHIGHALNNTLQDILARFERMRGKDVLWQPGTDHAGISTQLVVERKSGRTPAEPRCDGPREIPRSGVEVERRIWRRDRAATSPAGRILRLVARTLHDGRRPFARRHRKSSSSFTAKGLIYKDKRLVNWDPRLQTAVSDLEVENIEMKGHLWYIKYPIEGEMGQFITVATTRPETMLGDAAVAVHPDDERYEVSSANRCVLPLANRLIPIIADEHSDPEKGTGAVKITPAHDFNDFEVGKRHDLAADQHSDEGRHAQRRCARGLSRTRSFCGAQDSCRRSRSAGTASTISSRSRTRCRTTKRPRPSCSSPI